MATRHIITIGYQSFAVESRKDAADALALLAKLQPVRHETSGSYDTWFYTPEIGEHARHHEVGMKANQPYRATKAEKPVKAPKSLALPAPKKGTILCICEHSYVAPKETCAHCGRAFSESHNRTHGDKPTTTKPQLRLL
jgi:hypothetical protein